MASEKSEVSLLRDEVKTLKEMVEELKVMVGILLTRSNSCNPVNPLITTLNLKDGTSEMADDACPGKKMKRLSSEESGQSGKKKIGQIEVNPLLFEVILQNVVTFLDYKTLKSARLVCPMWNEVFLRKFQMKTNLLIYFKNRHSAGKFLEMYESSRFSDSQKEVNSIQIHHPFSFIQKPFKIWTSLYGRSITRLTLGPTPPFGRMPPASSKTMKLTAGTLQSLLTVWCPNLKELRISHLVQLSGNEFPPNFNETEAVLDLNLLEILDGSWSDSDDTDYNQFSEFVHEFPRLIRMEPLPSHLETMKFATFLKAVLRHLNSLARFKCTNISKIQKAFTVALADENSRRILQNVKTLELLHLQDLNVTFIISRSRFTNLSVLKLGNVAPKSSDVSALLDVMREHRLTLRELDIKWEPHGEVNRISISNESLEEMSALQVFKGCAISVFDFSTCVNFRKKFPKLISLDLEGREDSELVDFFSNQFSQVIQKSVHGLRKLSVDTPVSLLSIHTFNLVSLSFPVLTELRIRHNEKLLETTINHLSSFRKLKYLEIQFEGGEQVQDIEKAASIFEKEFNCDNNDLQKFDLKCYENQYIKGLCLNSKCFENGFFKMVIPFQINFHHCEMKLKDYEFVTSYLFKNNLKIKVNLIETLIRSDHGEFVKIESFLS